MDTSQKINDLNALCVAIGKDVGLAASVLKMETNP